MADGRLDEINEDLRQLKAILRKAQYPTRLISAIETRALRSGRRQTGVFQSNRQSRWTLIHDDPEHGTDPQYGSEVDCKAILIRLLLGTLEFVDAPAIADPSVAELFRRYFNRDLDRNSYRDSLLLEHLDFKRLAYEAENPQHGRSEFHIGHENPQITPKHVPENIAWRTLRSNLIQGDMTLREARIYIIKLIARYFELGELDIDSDS